MAFVEDIVTPLRRLESALNEALQRLQQAPDSEALHDLRVSLRRIRSLLRPLHGCPGATRRQTPCEPTPAAPAAPAAAITPGIG